MNTSKPSFYNESIKERLRRSLNSKWVGLANPNFRHESKYVKILGRKTYAEIWTNRSPNKEREIWSSCLVVEAQDKRKLEGLTHKQARAHAESLLLQAVKEELLNLRMERESQ